MKKVFAIMAVAGMFAFVSCGPKAEEQATEATETTEQVMDDAANDMSAAAEEVTEETVAATDSVATAVEGTTEEAAQ